MTIIYLALGSNLGDRPGNLARALESLPPEMTVEAVSSIYETEPAYVLDQPRFLNMAARAGTHLGPEAALAYLKTLETRLGRQPGQRFGPRLIDLDLLLYGDTMVTTPEVTIPHPRLHERAFVLAPLNDIAGMVVHPVLKVAIGQLLDRLPETERRQVWKFDSPTRRSG